MNPFASMRRLYERGPDCRGLTVDRDGVALGPGVTLVQRVGRGYLCIGEAEATKLTRALFGAGARVEGSGQR